MSKSNSSTLKMYQSILKKFYNIVSEKEGHYIFNKPLTEKELFDCLKAIVIRRFYKIDQLMLRG